MDQQAIDEMRETLVRLRLALASLRLSLLARKYDPNQPRAPGGGPDGGRWVSDGLGGADAAPPVSGGLLIESAWKPTDRIDLRQEELQGGHAIAKHVGKSDGQLRAALERERGDTPALSVFWLAEGSFSTVESANDYTNKVLQSFPGTVDNVASGKSSDEFLQLRFNSPTGREAWRIPLDPKGIVRLRDTFWVGVQIVHVGHGKGFVVRTAYPNNRGSSY